jgi:two-component system, NarL family, invasion response regulator UvrY
LLRRALGRSGYRAGTLRTLAMESDRATASRLIRVLLVDDHPAVRDGLALLLALEDIEVCAEAGGTAGALACIERNRPDLAIVDLSLDGEDGLTLIADLRQRGMPVLVYSMHRDVRHVRSAVAAGARGYVTKRELPCVLVDAIREVAAGQRFVSPSAAAALADSVTEDAANDAVSKLSSNERKVYELLGQGEGTYEIAAALRISNHTVESYYERMKLKMNVSGMHDLRRHAFEYFQKHTG